MVTKQGTKAAPSGTKKAGAAKKGAAPSDRKGLSVVEGGKGKPAAVAPGTVLLGDGKTPASREALAKALGVYKVKFDANAPTEDLLALVRKHLAKVLKPMKDDDKMKCAAVCGEVSTQDTDFCPFCGDEGATEGELAAAAPGEAEAEEEPEATASTAIAPAASGDAIQAATAALDECVQTIKVLCGDIAKNSYDLGLQIRRIHEEELWKARGYESFKDFTEKELEIGRTMAYRLMDTTKQFTRETFADVGSTKLALIASIQDPEEREAAITQAKAGATTKDVQRVVNETKARSSAPAKESKPAAPSPKKANEITLLAKVGSKPQLHGFRSASSNRPINHHKDDAYCEFSLSEDVKQRIALKIDKDGNVVGLMVAFVRVE